MTDEMIEKFFVQRLSNNNARSVNSISIYIIAIISPASKPIKLNIKRFKENPFTSFTYSPFNFSPPTEEADYGDEA